MTSIGPLTSFQVKVGAAAQPISSNAAQAAKPAAVRDTFDSAPVGGVAGNTSVPTQLTAFCEHLVNGLFADIVSEPWHSMAPILRLSTAQKGNAICQLHEHFEQLDGLASGNKTGRVSRDDLKAALEWPELTAEQKDACHALIDCGMQTISKETIDNIFSRMPRARPSFEQQWVSSLEQLAKHFDQIDANGSGTISRDELNRANSKPFPAEMRSAAYFIFRSPELDSISEVSKADVMAALAAARANL